MMMRRIAVLAFVAFLAVFPARAAQNTLTTPGSPLNMTGLATFLNNAFTSVATNYSGSTPPAVCTGGTACVYQYWLDTSTTPRVLRINDGTQWVPIGNLDTTGHSFSISTAEITVARSGSTDTIADSDRGSLVRYTNATSTASTLPRAGAASSFASGWYVDVRSASTGTVTITPTISTINGASTLTLPPGLSVRIISDGTNYFTTQTIGTPTTAVLGGVFSKAAVSSNWLRSLGTDGNLTASQPAFTDISGTAAPTQGGTGLTAYNTGDIIYGSASNTLAALAGNITTTRKFMRQTGNGAVSAAPAWDTIVAADIPGSALTKTDDTNVTLTLGGTPSTSLLNSASITVGWTGTLAAARLNSNTPQSIGNDTNVTGSITAQVLNLGWTGTLAAGRLNSNVVQAVTADTNIGGSITAQNLTFAWVGTLANGRLATMATNTVKGNATAGTASPTDLAIGGCSAASSALIWTTNTGFGCNTSITAAAVPASGLTGTTLASNVVATSITSVGTLTGGATGAGFTVALTTSTITGTLPCANHPALTGDVTTSAGNCATTAVNLPTGVTQAGYLLATNIAAPTTPAAGKNTFFSDSTDLRFHDKNASGIIGTTVVADTGAANNYVSAISAAGVITKSRPTCSTLSDSTDSCSRLNASANTASTLVLRDGSGNFSAGTITAALTGNASTATALQTARAIYGNNFDGTAALTQIIASTYGGTGNGFAKLSGPASSEKTFTLPNASAAILTDNAAVTIAQGGSGQTTALAARGSSGFNIDSCTSTGDANYTVLSTDRCIYHSSLTAARTDTMPAASAYNPGQRLYITDFAGQASGVKTLTMQRAGADTINGGSSAVLINGQYGVAIMISDGVSKWTNLVPGSGGGGSGTVTGVTCGNGLACPNTGSTISTTGTVNALYARQFMLPL